MRRYRSIPTIADIDRRLRRRKWINRGIASSVVLVGLLLGLDHFGEFGHTGNDWATLDQQEVVVTKVIDGDTVHVQPKDGGRDEKVRLLGIDAAELHPPHNEPAAYWAEQATSYLSGRTLDKTVILKLEPTQTRDRYGRLLGYLFINDSDNLNFDMVRDGQVYADRRFKHTYKAQFEQAEGEARKKRRGLWKEVDVKDMPPWRQRWLAEIAARDEKRR